MRRGRVRATGLVVLLAPVSIAGCELEDVAIPRGESIVVVSAVMRPDLPYQFVIVELSLDGRYTGYSAASWNVPIPPRGPRIPVQNAYVAVANLDLPGDPCGNSVQFRHTPSAPWTGPVAGIYWAPVDCPTMRPGDRLQLTVETTDGRTVTGLTRVPGMNGAFLAVGNDSVALGGRDSVMTFNRDRDTLHFGVDAIAGRLLQLDVRRHGYLTDYGTKMQFDTTDFLLAGSALDLFVLGSGDEVFRGGRSYGVTLTLSDTNYFDFSRSSNNEFTGRGFINRLSGGIGVFGSAVAATSRVWVIADFDDPREGLYHITGTVDGADVDVMLRVYVHRPTESTDVSAFFEGSWFMPRLSRRQDDPLWQSEDVAGKSVDGAFLGERLHMVISDTLPQGVPWYVTLDGLFSMDSDSIRVFVAESTVFGVLVPIDTLVAERLRTP